MRNITPDEDVPAAILGLQARALFAASIPGGVDAARTAGLETCTTSPQNIPGDKMLDAHVAAFADHFAPKAHNGP